MTALPVVKIKVLLPRLIGLSNLRQDSFNKRFGGGGDCRKVFVLKADIKHYFDTVDHAILIQIISRKVKDQDVIWLIKTILQNYDSGASGKGMPLGNWTSQFFANIYLNELDQFVKHQLKVKYYIRYVDDFVILHTSWNKLNFYQEQIEEFLKTVKLTLHPTKCSIAPLSQGINFLGFKVFPHHRIPRKRNVKRAREKIMDQLSSYTQNHLTSSEVFDSMNGWFGYAMQGNTYSLRKRIRDQVINWLESKVN